MELNIVRKGANIRGTGIAALEPRIRPSFKDLVKNLEKKPWLSWVLGTYIIEFLNDDPTLALKLNLLAVKPKMQIYQNLLSASDLDLFTLILLIDIHNCNGQGWISNSLDTSNPKFIYLEPSLKRAYNSELCDSREIQLILWQLEREAGFFDPDIIGWLKSQVKQQLKEYCKNLIPQKMEKAFIHIKELAKPSSNKSDYYYFTSLREVPISQTIEKFKREKILTKAGAVESSIEGPRYEHGTYHYVITRNVDLKIDDLNIFIKGQQKSSGKGISEELAWTSMAAEVVERYSALMGISDWPECYKNDLDFTYSRMEDLIQRGRTEKFHVLDPNRLNLIYPYQNEKTYWIKGCNVEENSIYVLAEAVFLPYVRDSPIFRYQTSNGLASGNTLDEAKLHAFCEIIERDSKARAIGQGMFKILGEKGIPELNRILKSYQKENLVVYVRDVTMELGVPTYRVYLATKDKKNLSACGTSLNGNAALIRALAELHPYISDAREKGNLVRGIPKFLKSAPHLDLDSIPNYSTGNVAEDVRLLEDLFLKNNFSPIYVDLTVRDINFPVIRLLIPGWEHETICYNNFRYFTALYHGLNE